MADDLGKVLDAMEKSGLAQKVISEFKPTTQMCIICGKDTPILELFTGEARQRMCESCRRTYYDFAKILCRSCGKFLGFMKSGIAPNGYHVKRDETLHTPWCDHCDKERAKAGSAPIEELTRYMSIQRQNELAGAVSSGKGVIDG